MRFFMLAALPLLASGAQAQNDPAPSPPENPPVIAAPVCCTIPALQDVSIKFGATVNSQANKIGEKIPISLAEPIVVNGVEIVPAGAKGEADVVHAAKSRFGGKAGELIVGVRFIEHAGVRIPLRSLRYSKGQGKDNTGAAIAVGVVAGLASLFVTGGEVTIPEGTVAYAKIARDTVVPGQAAPPVNEMKEAGSVTTPANN